MASKMEYRRKTATKRNRSKAKGKATRRKVTVRNRGGKLSMQEIQYADTLAHMKKNLLKAEEMGGKGEYSMRGYSRRMSYDDGRSYADGSYAREEDFVRPDGSYSRRGRDSMGRYSSEGSVDERTKQELMKMIERM